MTTRTMKNDQDLVILTESECRIAKYVGRLRNKLSAASKPNMRRDPNQSDEGMNIQAAGAELAVARLLNVYPDITPTDDDVLPQFDLVYNSNMIEVKRNHLPNGDLLIPKKYNDLIYVLVCGSMPLYNVVGFIAGASVALLGEWVDLTYGACWRVKPIFLSRIIELTKGGK